MKAVRIKQLGGPEVISFDDVDQPQPADTEVLIKIETAGIDYIDTYQRSGLYDSVEKTTFDKSIGCLQRFG